MTEPTPADLETLIAEFQKSGLRELHVRRDGFEIYLSNDADAGGVNQASVSVTRADPVAPAAVEIPAEKATGSSTPVDIPDGAHVVRAPYLGTFYRSPKPGSDPYVEIGQRIDALAELCLVEVMKLFTAVQSSAAGTIHAILAKDGEMVAADQPLFVILPD